jgi:hypothetical protein
MASITYRVGSIAPFHANAELNELACISCGKDPKGNTCWKWEVYIVNGRLISSEWTQADMALVYVCETCSVKFADNVLSEGS